MNQLNVFLLWISLWISVRILTTIFCSIDLFKYLIRLLFFFTTLNYFFIYPPPSLSYFIWLPWQWYIRHTQRRACYYFLCLSEYGDSASVKHLLLYFLTNSSQCHQPQDHEGHQQIPANPDPPSQQQSLSSQN